MRFDRVKFALAVYRTRKARGVTLSGLQEASGLSRGFLCDIESCKRAPGIETFFWLCGWMESDMSNFVLRKDDDSEKEASLQYSQG